MIVAVVLALEYDLFRFGDQLTADERRISLGELLFLSALLAAGIFAFILRRLYEGRKEAAKRIHRDVELEQLREKTLRDPLTGVLNRRGILEALSSATSGLNQVERQHAFFLLGLDEFKRVNDLHGHSVGDQVLKVVVERIKAASRPTDILARLDGGDVFAVLAYDVDRDEAQVIGRRLVAALQSDIFADGSAHKVGACVGAVMLPEQGITSGEILSKADLAMYRAKGADQSALVFFEATDVPSQS
jgi:diguanylate cyclase (GGDEF)-like protein